ncbi:MAG TPA: SH3 domain-containing protein [Thermoanaerobaculia bacterium]|nr:SH3 domain-containing protein [Thermoanaerobaculia bacterium]
MKRLLAALLLLQVTVAAAQVGKLLPTDEAVRDPALFAFRAQLQAAVARHDSEAVLAAVHPNIKNSFGGDDGIDAFKRIWKLPGHDSPLWDELGTVLALGGAFHDSDTFAAPYVYQRWPERFDSFEHVAVLGTGVRVRSEPGLNGRILTSLSFDVVRLDGPAGDSGWTRVKLRDSRTGYISSRYVRSPVDYRALFEKADGRWRLAFFVAGD